VWTQAVKPLGPIAYIIRARTVLLRDLGAAISPFNAFQILQGSRRSRCACRALRERRAGRELAGARPEVTRVIHPASSRARRAPAPTAT
jgi:O-acetylhomoserine (thiol)-lyase